MASYSVSGVTARAESVSVCHLEHVVTPGEPSVKPITMAAYEIEPYLIMNGIPVPVTGKLVCQSNSRLSSEGDPGVFVQEPVDVAVPFTYRWSGFDLRPVGGHGPLQNFGGISVNTTIQWGNQVLKRSGVNTTLGYMRATGTTLSPDCTVVTVAMIRGTTLPLLLCDSTSVRSGIFMSSNTAVAMAQSGLQVGSSALAPTTSPNIPVVIGGFFTAGSCQVFCIDGQGIHYGKESPVITGTSLPNWLVGEDPTPLSSAANAPAVIFEVILLDRLMTPSELTTLLALAASYGVH